MDVSFSGEAIAKALMILAVIVTISLALFFFIVRGHINLWRSKDEKHLATIIPLTWLVFIIFSYFIAYIVYPEFARNLLLPIGGNFKEEVSFVILVTLISLLSCSHIAFVEKIKRKEGSPVLSKAALYSFALSFTYFPISLLLAPIAISKIERSEGRIYGKRFVWVAMAINLLVISCLPILSSAFYFKYMVGWWVMAFVGTAVVLWMVALVSCLIIPQYRLSEWWWTGPLYVLGAIALVVVLHTEYDTLNTRQAFKLALQGDVAQMKALLDNHPKLIKAEDYHGFTLLGEAIAGDSAPVVELLLARGADINSSNYWTAPVILAIKQQSPSRPFNDDITRLVLERVTEISAMYDRSTLLYVAVDDHNKKAVELLLARGASLYLGDDNDTTPMEIAGGVVGSSKDPDIFALLLREAEARSKIKWDTNGTWTGTGKSYSLTLTLDSAQNAKIQQIRKSGEWNGVAYRSGETLQAQYRVNYAKRPALLEFYNITSPDYKEGKSLWAIIEIAPANTMVFGWLGTDYTEKTGDRSRNFFKRFEAVILKRGTLKTGDKAL
jgi:hypothetical protein